MGIWSCSKFWFPDCEGFGYAAIALEPCLLSGSTDDGSNTGSIVDSEARNASVLTHCSLQGFIPFVGK